jgi:hypothetical protein
MIHEIVNLHIKLGQENQIKADFIQASTFITQSPGYLRHTLKECIEKEKNIFLKWNGNL